MTMMPPSNEVMSHVAFSPVNSGRKENSFKYGRSLDSDNSIKRKNENTNSASPLCVTVKDQVFVMRKEEDYMGFFHRIFDVKNAEFHAFLDSTAFNGWDLINPASMWNKWVLVPEGSIVGAFNFLPSFFRVGPWSTAALYYLTLLLGFVITGAIYFTMSKESLYTISLSELDYPAAYSTQWYYNVVGSIWMVVTTLIGLSTSVGGLKNLATYTVQSWTLLMTRHILCVVGPFYQPAYVLAEIIRFPVACSATITFVVWNLVLFPFLYLFALQEEIHRNILWGYHSSFALSNFHIVNFFLCLGTCWNWSGENPSHLLGAFDMYIALVSVIGYLVFYLFVLDRIGVHFYCAFSPRTGNLGVVASWSSILILYAVMFVIWRHLLWPEDDINRQDKDHVLWIKQLFETTWSSNQNITMNKTFFATDL